MAQDHSSGSGKGAWQESGKGASDSSGQGAWQAWPRHVADSGKGARQKSSKGWSDDSGKWYDGSTGGKGWQNDSRAAATSSMSFMEAPWHDGKGESPAAVPAPSGKGCQYDSGKGASREHFQAAVLGGELVPPPGDIH